MKKATSQTAKTVKSKTEKRCWNIRCAFKQLSGLNLLDNQFSGSIPDLTGVEKLRTIHLRNNPLCKNPDIDDGKWTEKLKKFPMCTE
ncbi:MAG: hypothetical protein GY801_31205 [bacterium]|nr:hypothetical protein [bacterium]